MSGIAAPPVQGVLGAVTDSLILAALTHEKVGHTGQGLWHHKGRQLPAYIQHIANDLIHERGMTESTAIATAVSRCKVWCAGGGGVQPDTKAKACAAVAEWEALKAEVHAGWDEAAHPRVPGGDTGGGQFAPGGSGAPPPKATPKPASKRKTPITSTTQRHLSHFLHLAHLAHLHHRGSGQGPSPAEVRSAQRQLNKALGLNLAVDGIFGPKTLAAVKEYQRQHSTPIRKTPARAPRKRVPVKRVAAAEGPQLVTIPGVEILAAGTWQLSSGRQTFTRQDLTDAVAAAGCPAVGAPIIKIGHLDPRFAPKPGEDGEPALGRLANMRTDSSGVKLLADLAGMPGWLAGISASAFPRRSVEGTYKFHCQIGHQHPFVITALALLGVTAPGVGVLQDLRDLSELFYHAARGPRDPGEPWRTGPIESTGGTMPVTEEDVRRAYYAGGEIPQSWWITEMQMAPSQLIVSDGDGRLFQVPFTIQGSSVSFGDAAQLESYEELAGVRGSGPAVLYASAEDSRRLGAAPPAEPDDLDESWADLTGLPADLAGLGVAEFEAADLAAYGIAASASDEAELEAAAKLGTGARSRALMSHLSGQGVRNPGALVAWIGRKKYGKARFQNLANKARTAHAAGGVAVDAAGNHAACSTTHSHPHPAMGTQGADATHAHMHTHSGDASHSHAHAAGDPNRNGGSDVDFTDEQLAAVRTALQLEDGAELSAAQLVDGLTRVRAAAGARQPLPQGVIAVDQERWDALNGRVQAAEAYQRRQEVAERDAVIAQAVRDGKFSAARRPAYQRMWDADPANAREVIASLHKNVVPVDDLGAPGGDADDLLDTEYRALFPPGSVKSG
jgi:hypothetical protein